MRLSSHIRQFCALMVAFLAVCSRATETAPPDFLTAAPASATSINLTWSDTNDETGYTIERREENGTFAAVTTKGANTTSHLDTYALAGSRTYSYRMRADYGASHSPWVYSSPGAGLPTDPVTTAESGGLPGGWSTADIGQPPAAAGQNTGASYASSVFTISGGGTGITGGSDAFRFVSQPISGDGSIVAKITSVGNTDHWAKAGVMIRESLDPDARQAGTYMTPALQVKWHPGQGVQTPGVLEPHPTNGNLGYTPSMISEVSEISDVTHLTYIAYWGYLEPTKDNYVFTEIDNLLQLCHNAHKRLVLMVWDRVFTTTGNFDYNVTLDFPSGKQRLPRYIYDDPEYANGYYVGPSEIVARLWTKPVMDRLIALQQALAAHYDGNPDFEAIVLAETSVNESPASGYTPSVYVAQLKRYIDTAKNAWAHTNVWFMCNSLTPDASMQELINYMAYNRMMLSDPDIRPKDFLVTASNPAFNPTTGEPSYGTQGQRVYQGLAGDLPFNYSGMMGDAPYVQGPNLGGNHNPKDENMATALNDIYGWSQTYLNASYLPWLRKDFTYHIVKNGVETTPSDIYWATELEGSTNPLIKDWLISGNHPLKMDVPTNYKGASKGITFWRRTNPGDNSTGTTVDQLTAPYWVKLERSGNTFISSYSPDNNNWTVIGSQIIPMGKNVYAGLAVSSQNDAEACSAQFESVSLSSGGGGATPVEAEDLTVSASSGDTSSTITYASASGGQYLKYSANAASDFVTLTVNAPATQTYDITVQYEKSIYTGIVQLAVDGTARGTPQDTYNNGSVLSPFDLGTMALTAGNHSFKFTVADKNALSTGYQIRIDSITLTPVTGDTTAPAVSMTAPSGGATVSGATVTLSATASDNVGVAGVQFLLDDTIPLGTEDGISPYGIVWDSTAVANGSHTVTARARDASGNTTYATDVNVTLSNTALPAGWNSEDVGAVGAIGDAAYASGVFSVNGAGADIIAADDRFRYVYQSVSGDYAIVARVATQQNTNAWAKSGLMIRESLLNNAAQACINLTPTNGVAFQWRNTAGVSLTQAVSTGPGIAAPYWVKLVRTNDVFSAYASGDGTTWFQVGTSQTIPMAAEVNIGLDVTSHVSATLCNATFDNVSITGSTQDNTAPSITLSAPGDGSTVSGASVAVSATASDNVGVAGVQFKLDDTNLGSEDTVTPYAVTWDTTAATDGEHTLRAEVRDVAGNITSSGTATVTVANSTPAAPDDLVVTRDPASSFNTVDLTWTDNSSIETSFRIERKVAGGTYSEIDSTGPNEATFIDTTAGSGTIYYYRVRARSAIGDSSYASEVSVKTAEVTNGLQGYWRFDETSGTSAADSSGNGNTGTLVNGPTWVAGQVGNGVHFDKVDDSVSCGSGGNLDNLSAITVSAWIKPASAGEGNFGAIVRKGSGTGLDSDAGFRFVTHANGQLEFTIDYSGGDLGMMTVSSAYITTGVWQHVMATWDGTNDYTHLHVYVDGTEVARDSGGNGTGTHSSDAAYNLRIGNNEASTATFDGSIDDVRIYNRALTTDEAKALSRAVSTGDILPPTVAVTAPTDDATVSGTSVTLSATASDNVGVVGVQFMLDDEPIGIEDTSSSYGITWDSTSVTDGAYTLTAAARDIAGNITLANDISIVVSNNVPTSPTGIVAAKDGSVGYGEVNLTWADNSSTETSFRIERKVAGGSYVEIAWVGAGVTSYSDTTAGSGTTYVYRIRARNSVGDSGYALEQTVTTEEVTSGRQGHWKFDETSGTSAADSSGNGNTGTLVNGPTWVAGQVGNGVHFDKVDDSVSCGSGGNLDNLSAITVSAWIKPASAGEGNFGAIVRKGSGTGLDSDAGFRFVTHANGQLEFTIDYSGGDLGMMTVSSAYITTGVWQHVMATWDGTNDYTHLHVYVDGTEVARDSGGNGTGTHSSDAAYNLRIGNNEASTATFDGSIDDVSIYNRALTSTEIEAVFHSGR